MKKHLVATMALTMIGSLLVGEHQATYAYNTFGHTLNGGVGSYGTAKRYYFVDSTASSYSSTIDTAMSEWVYSTAQTGVTTSLSYRSTTTQSSSVMDWYGGNFYDQSTGVIAETSWWLTNSLIDPAVANWGWSKENINTPVFSTLSAWNQRGSVAHEMGHGFGLAHSNNNLYVIMCQLGVPTGTRQVQSATVDDLNGVNAIYH